METIKNEFWWAVIDTTNDRIDSVHFAEDDADTEAETYEDSECEAKVERVRVTIDRIKTS